MKEVPKLPKNFDDWVIKNCFKETLFYERERPYRWSKSVLYALRSVYGCTNCGWSTKSMGQTLNAQSAE